MNRLEPKDIQNIEIGKGAFAIAVVIGMAQIIGLGVINAYGAEHAVTAFTAWSLFLVVGGFWCMAKLTAITGERAP